MACSGKLLRLTSPELRSRDAKTAGQRSVLCASILIAAGWIWVWKDATPDDKPVFYAIGGAIFFIGLAVRYILTFAD